MSVPVTICIPAYKAAGFLADTVESALSQTHPDIQIVIAVDPSSDATARIAQRFGRGRTRVLLNSRRLGWIGNTNHVLSQARTRHAMILPHDDLLEPDYVEACLDALLSNDKAVVSYTDMDRIGQPDSIYPQPAITGDLYERIEDLLLRHFNCVPYRGLIDRQAAPLHQIPFSTGGYAADTLFLAQMACQGEIVRVPSILCHKRMHEGSEHVRWRPGSAREYQEMWAVHCVEIMSVILRTVPELEWTDELHDAWQARAHGVLLAPNLRINAPAGMPLGDHIMAIAEGVKRRPVPYAWVKPLRD